MRQNIEVLDLRHGVLRENVDEAFPTRVSAWVDAVLTLGAGATHFGFVQEGRPLLIHPHGRFELVAGMYFSLPATGSIGGQGRGIVMSRVDLSGFFSVGGPIEERGRLRYIDGCTDSLLLAPVSFGEPCLNLLCFPPATTQTRHQHPSVRAGIVTRGSGECVTDSTRQRLTPGLVFLIPSGCPHAFVTEEQGLSVIAYHPDSDFGPSDGDHPMINRTIVDGRSAAELPGIRTR